MGRPFVGYGVFIREFCRNFQSTGSVVPSGRYLASALARHVRDGQADSPRRILEVGPGTGAVTEAIVAGLRPEDRLDLCELNESFVAALRERFATEPPLQQVADRVRILHQRIEELAFDEPYDLIISGLPLNNFAVRDVEQILEVLERLLRPGGTLSFFEYIAVRMVRGMFAGKAERERLSGIGQALDRVLRDEVRRDWIWLNVPPAWVHHVQTAADPSLVALPSLG